MEPVIDCTSTPSVQALKDAGITTVIRYLSPPDADWKVIHLPEYQRLVNGGIDVQLVWEYYATDWNTGATGAKIHATMAVEQARALLYPSGHVIYSACDFDTPFTPTIMAYGNTFNTIVKAAGYNTGVYGPYDVIDGCWAHHLFDVYWQAGMSTAWSGGRNARAHIATDLIQVNSGTVGGVSVDFNRVLDSSYLGEKPMSLADYLNGWDPPYDIATKKPDTRGPLVFAADTRNFLWDGRGAYGTTRSDPMGPSSGTKYYIDQLLKIIRETAEKALAQSQANAETLAKIQSGTLVSLTDSQIATLAHTVVAEIQAGTPDVAAQVARVKDVIRAIVGSAS